MEFLASNDSQRLKYLQPCSLNFDHKLNTGAKKSLLKHVLFSLQLLFSRKRTPLNDRALGSPG